MEDTKQIINDFTKLLELQHKSQEHMLSIIKSYENKMNNATNSTNNAMDNSLTNVITYSKPDKSNENWIESIKGMKVGDIRQFKFLNASKSVEGYRDICAPDIFYVIDKREGKAPKVKRVSCVDIGCECPCDLNHFESDHSYIYDVKLEDYLPAGYYKGKSYSAKVERSPLYNNSEELFNFRVVRTK